MEGEERRSGITTRRSQPYLTAYAAAAQRHLERGKEGKRENGERDG
jgi:hypothetical protein